MMGLALVTRRSVSSGSVVATLLSRFPRFMVRSQPADRAEFNSSEALPSPPPSTSSFIIGMVFPSPCPVALALPPTGTSSQLLSPAPAPDPVPVPDRASFFATPSKPLSPCRPAPEALPPICAPIPAIRNGEAPGRADNRTFLGEGK